MKLEFETDGGDVAFSIKFVDTDHRIHELVAESRVPSDLESIRKGFKIPGEGTLIFKWNNEYSWFASKSLSYMIELKQVISRIFYIF